MLAYLQASAGSGQQGAQAGAGSRAAPASWSDSQGRAPGPSERLPQGSGSPLDAAGTRAETWGAAERSSTKLSLSTMPALVSKTDEWVALRKSWTRPGHQNFKGKREFQRRTSGAQSLGRSVFDGASLCPGSWDVQVPSSRWLCWEVKKESPGLCCLGVHASKSTSDHQLTIGPSGFPNRSWDHLGEGAGSRCCRLHCWNSQECRGTVRGTGQEGCRDPAKEKWVMWRQHQGPGHLLLLPGSCCRSQTVPEITPGPEALRPPWASSGWWLLLEQ